MPLPALHAHRAVGAQRRGADVVTAGVRAVVVRVGRCGEAEALLLRGGEAEMPVGADDAQLLLHGTLLAARRQNLVITRRTNRSLRRQAEPLRASRRGRLAIGGRRRFTANV